MQQPLLKSFEEVLVVGSGLMGAGIAQVIAESGVKVILVDRTEFELERAKKQIEKMVNKLKGNDGLQETLDRITFSTKIQDGHNCLLAIEAVPEKLEIKKAIFKQLDELLPEHAIIASNTSSLSIAAISSVTKRPENIVGMHFFSPVPIMNLVEVVEGINTSHKTVETIQQFGEQIGKQVILAKDYPGFTVNRVLVPMLNEAAFLVMEGNDPAEIDLGLMLGANHPIGPLKLTDSVGVDVLFFTLESLYEGFNDSKYRPCPLLKRMVEAGHLGKKSGKGFYDYKGR
ncbi:3-hydroxyacyl-CoA dehydrogenase family protein [Viridibacillus sp. NPDC093762]|uniref:3-hydroxyacyl-CoA dehydrogenase family protein n=1 Tax=Viridibacillus sp. NPDC093762 TaxID=3390720 RepID=UPI003D07A563